MKITTTASLVGFLLALSSVNLSKAEGAVRNATIDSEQSTIESRLTRISKAIRQQEGQDITSMPGAGDSYYIAGGFVNHSGGGGGTFANRNGGGGGFVNHNGGAGHFLNHKPGWVNRTQGWINR